MRSKRAKALVAVIILVACVSLAISLILINRHRGTRIPIHNLKSAQNHLALKIQPADKQEKNQTPAHLKNHNSINSTALSAQPSDLQERTSEFSSETSADQNELSENADAFFREEIQGMLAEALEEDFPELNLNKTELEELTDAVMSIRESLQAIRVMERTGENAEALMQLQERRNQAMLDFERITDMNALKFMLQAPADGGIDRD
jgi:hypothetical protein